MSPCDACTAICCRDYAPHVAESDAIRIEAAGHDRSEFLVVEKVKRFRLQLHEQTSTPMLGVVARKDAHCMFLDVDDLGAGRCAVYDARPQICREFDLHSCEDNRIIVRKTA